MSPVTRHSSPRTAGVALVVTIILIAAITFMAITFLSVSRREKGSVTTATDQTTARLAAAAGLERAKAEMLAPILAASNALNFHLLVSTNFINWDGFDPNTAAVVDQRTNVNFEYQNDLAHTPLTLDQARQNLTNLLYSPRPPVFVVTNRATGANEFRFYLDLNRNGRYEPSGFRPILDDAGLPVGTNFSFFVGDPEWIGQLARPDLPHSAANFFVSRYAYVVIPAGETLDVNYIHNYAVPAGAGNDGFFRNQGVGSWEINLAAFLRDLNTNVWNDISYSYFPTAPTPSSSGVAFDDALAFLTYRAGGNLNSPLSVSAMFTNGQNAFLNDFVDGYSAGPLMTNYWGWNVLPDGDATRVNLPWWGAPNTNHYFTTQDFYDKNKTRLVPFPGGLDFTDRLLQATTNSASSYDRYTYYRLLSQLGTDSAPEPPDKMNLNYDNLVQSNAITSVRSATNFLIWRPLDFFTNAVDRLVKQYSKDWHDSDAINGFVNYTNMFGMTNLMSAGNIPVFVNGRFTYTPAIHRLLQLAANMYDAINPTNDIYGPLPRVFRPQFDHLGNNNNLFITNFVEVTSANQLTGTLRDLSTTNVVAAVQPNDLIFGVPLVVGARKGLPNFNEFAAETVIQITRKLELVKSGPGGGGMINQTNQMFVIGISNVFATEFWNSYATNYTRPVDIIATNFCQVLLTNDYTFSYNTNLIAAGQISIPSPGTNFWAAWNPKRQTPPATGLWSFLVPLRTNHIIVPDAVYRLGSASGPGFFDNLTNNFERPSGFAFPRWVLAITNRLVAIIKEPGANGRIIDYVQLNGLGIARDLTAEIAQQRTGIGFEGLWATNASLSGGGKLSDQPGIIQQIEISKGNVESGGNWQSYGIAQPAGATKAQAIAKFLAFINPNNTATYVDPGTRTPYSATNYALAANAPFTPTSKRSVPITWQANDPLVHYMSGDMEYLERSGSAIIWKPSAPTNATLSNIGILNERYRPWGGNPKVGGDLLADPLAYQTVVKDPGVTSSDAWQFPTNKLPTLGWLGRIHRGTPWQTVYLKSSRVADAVQIKAMKADDWPKWTGNRNLYNAALTQPETDRGIFDLFTTAFNDNAARGQLPINQPGLAAWSAVFGGMVALSNSVPDADLFNGPAFEPLIIPPAGAYAANTNTWPGVAKIVDGINRTRASTNLFPLQTFPRLGDLLATPELTEASPFLNHGVRGDDGHNYQLEKGLNDAVYEWLPQQMLSLVRLGDTRFVVYSYGQTLRPAPHSIYLNSGPFFGMCTNYQITAEVATRAVVRIEGAPTNSHVVIENYNVLPPD